MLKYCPRIIKLFRRTPRYFISQEKFEFTKEDIEKLKEFYEKGQAFEEDMSKKQKFAEYDEVFKEREQKISFQLMQMSEVDQVFQLYSDELVKQLDEKNPEKPFSANELSLFLYFTSCLRNEEYADQMKNHSDRFQQIASKILLEIDKLEPEQFCAFLWALSTYQIEMGDLNLNESKQYLIKQQTQNILQRVPPETLPPLAFSIKHILKDKNELILQISKLTQQNISIQQPNNLITLIQCLPVNSFTNSKLIFEQLLDSFQQELLSSNQFLLVIIELLRITNYQKSEFTNQFLTAFIEAVDSTVKNKMDVQMSRVIDLIHGCMQIESEAAERAIKQLLRIFHSKSEKINITEYISLFLAVGKIKNKNYENINLDKTQKILIELSNKSQVFSLKDFEQKELVQLIIASAALRIDNKEYIGNIISKIQPEALHKQDLIMLAQSFIIYVRQFEFECLKIHTVCASKKSQFNAMEQAKLTQTFNRIKILIPDSPFFL